MKTIILTIIATASFGQDYLMEVKGASAENQNIVKENIIKIIQDNGIVLKSIKINAMGTDINKIPVIEFKIDLIGNIDLKAIEDSYLKMNGKSVTIKLLHNKNVASEPDSPTR